MNLKTITLGLAIAAVACGCKKNVPLTNANLGALNMKSGFPGADTSGLVAAAGGTVKLNGVTFRGIGVNYFDAFYRRILNNNDTSYKAGLIYLSQNHIPFIRFAANGFWPNENLYMSDSVKYYKYMDRFVKIADSLHIGLIPSLFFNPCSLSDKVSESYNKWGVTSSATIAAMKKFTTSFVNRYKNRRVIWGWEFGNEMNAYVDLYEYAHNFLPPVYVAGGTPSSRHGATDSLTTPMLVTAVTQFANTVRLYDTKRMIFTGNAMPEWNMYHRQRDSTSGTRWSGDNAAQYQQLLGIQNPAAVGTLCVHMYHPSTNESGRFTNNDSVLIAKSMAASLSLNRPLFVGEFGSPIQDTTHTQAYYESMLNAIVKNNVPLTAMWVFDDYAQYSTFDVSFPTSPHPTSTRMYQLTDIINQNTTWRTALGYSY